MTAAATMGTFSTALDPSELFRPFEACGPVLLAVSGGPDSMALLHLAALWNRSGGGPPIEAATVDHGLRPEAAAEAVAVGQAAARLGIPHHTLVWTGEKPRTRLQERARQARYDLLLTHARSIGAGALLTAHHADDQAETVLFRLLRGSGPAGLAGMARSMPRGGIVLGRPLLGVTKAELVDHCRGAGIGFVEDPSNRDPRFARVRMRNLLALLAQEGLQAGDLVRLAERSARAEAALESCAQAYFARLRAEAGEGRYACDLTPLRDAPREFLLRLIVQEMARVGGGAVRLDRAERLTERVEAALSAGAPLKSSLAGALLQVDAAGGLLISREPPRRRETRKEPGEASILFDAED